MSRERYKPDDLRQGQKPKSVAGGGLGRSSEEAFVMGVERRAEHVRSGDCTTTPPVRKPRHRKIDWHQTRGFISLTPKHFLDAYKKVRRNGGSAGVDGQRIRDFADNLTANLFTLWNRVSSGAYHPPAVRQVGIPKDDGSIRYLGIPTVSDRIVQQVIKDWIEPRLEAIFCDTSYGYRPGRSAHDALQVVRLGVRKASWVIDLDVASFFDELPHGLLRKALDRHVPEGWIRRLLDRWLEAPTKDAESGELVYRQGRGTPQGGVISPLLANLYLHYVLDKWLAKHHSDVELVRYADDAIIVCKSQQRAEWLREQLDERFRACGLRLHPEKTKVVFCKRAGRTSAHQQITFDFLGYRFQPCTKRRHDGRLFTSFDCRMSPKSSKKAIAKLRSVGFHRWASAEIDDIANALNPIIRGLLNYFGKFNPGRGLDHIMHLVNDRLARWAGKKYKKVGRSPRRAWQWLYSEAERRPKLFAHWEAGFSRA